VVRRPDSDTKAPVSARDFSALLSKTLVEFWELTPSQRDAYIARLLKSDPDLVMVVDDMLTLYKKAKTPRELGPRLRRDALG
jgi:hypothetical protein